MLIQRIRAVSSLNIILKRSFNHRKFHSNCNNFATNILNKQQLKSCEWLTVDRNCLRFYSSVSDTIDETKVHDFLNQLTKTIKYENSKNLDSYMQDFEVVNLLKNRVEILDYLQSLKELGKL